MKGLAGGVNRWWGGLASAQRLALVAWIGLLLVVGGLWLRGGSALVLLAAARDGLQGLPLGVTVLGYLVVSLVRPLLLFPATPWLLAAGFLFEPATALVVGYLATNGAALVGWATARWLGRGLVPPRVGEWLAMGGRPLLLVAGMRVANAPFDAVSFGCGAAGVPWGPFLAGSLLGSVPGIALLVLLGGSLGLSWPQGQRLLALGIALLLLGLLLAWRWWAARNTARGETR